MGPAENFMWGVQRTSRLCLSMGKPPVRADVVLHVQCESGTKIAHGVLLGTLNIRLSEGLQSMKRSEMERR